MKSDLPTLRIVGSLAATGRRRYGRAGVTLVELLVVVGIVLILVSLTAAMIQPVLEGRDIREAARMLNIYLAGAQARAAQRNLPVGVWLKRISNNPADPSLQVQASLEVFAAEVPPPYAGDALNSQATITASSAGYNQAELSSVTPLLIRDGDFVKLNYQGPFRSISNKSNVNSTTVSFAFDPPASYTRPVSVPFQIFRLTRPSRSTMAPLQLPNSVAIDIINSGIGTTDRFTNANSTNVVDPLILFSPSGHVDRVVGEIDGTPYNNLPLGSIALLVGRPEKIGNENLVDGNNLWVAIGHNTGRITTVELDPNNGVADLATARQFIQTGQTKGGR